MFLKAGAVSLVLLLASRLLGLLRESAQAAAFGTSGMGDVAVLMLTLPDWLAGVLVSGALAYVLLPHWATQSAAQQAQTQARVARWLLAGGAVGAVLLAWCQDTAVQLLAGGLSAQWQSQAALGLLWSALALPAALLAALWVTRLQHERDFSGLYAASLVVNSVLVVALYLIAVSAIPLSATTQLGLFLAVAMGGRLLWLHWRLQRRQPEARAGDPVTLTAPQALPAASLWLWAALSAGLPLALPLAARSLASGAGEGALATFNYAWKLVELPLVLAVQLVATLAFPAITAAMSRADGSAAGAPGEATPLAPVASPAVRPRTLSPAAVQAVRSAFVLAWTLACAAAAGLQLGAAALADLLFGWGRMPADSLADVARWGAIGAWGLLPQALIAVALTVLAVQGRLRAAAIAYALALAALLVLGVASNGQGAALMWMLNLLLAAVAALLVLAMWRPVAAPAPLASSAPSVSSATSATSAPALLPLGALLVPSGLLLALSGARAAGWLDFYEPKGLVALSGAALAAILIIAITALLSPSLRAALRR
jgi:peptidoglycan biosynthesis protein MviN/MurJ (putative lipid II flippase)